MLRGVVLTYISTKRYEGYRPIKIIEVSLYDVIKPTPIGIVLGRNQLMRNHMKVHTKCVGKTKRCFEMFHLVHLNTLQRKSNIQLSCSF